MLAKSSVYLLLQQPEAPFADVLLFQELLYTNNSEICLCNYTGNLDWTRVKRVFICFVYIYTHIYIFVFICSVWKEHKRDAGESVWREMNKTLSVSKSSLGPQVNKLQTSEKCTTFLSRRTIFGVITVVFLKCAVEGAWNQNFFHFSRPFMHEGWHPAAVARSVQVGRLGQETSNPLKWHSWLNHSYWDIMGDYKWVLGFVCNMGNMGNLIHLSNTSKKAHSFGSTDFVRLLLRKEKAAGSQFFRR